MALNLTPQELQNLQRLQYLQRLHRAQQIQQSAATNGPGARGAHPRQRGRHAAPGGDPTRRMLDEVGRANQQNRRAFKAWWRQYGQNLRDKLARDCARMSGEVQRYGVSRPEWFIIESSRDQLQHLIQGLLDAQKLALFDLAVARQAERGDITGDKVAVFNTVSGRQRDMPLVVA
ncbi:hypothetical protein KVR01_002184 [Diaporthe batatas]|uniref:uncharacterized protein n=1 Tax=Diaporthe batatas TaxID=748121 RepID=UPI001D03B06C|nr:uncharacterized protein KVR01_002184 [Diaporthe batatas]KAG8166495.1 hypothetical protein KVR01_002184 [Diaporthe batatas]